MPMILCILLSEFYVLLLEFVIIQFFAFRFNSFELHEIEVCKSVRMIVWYKLHALDWKSHWKMPQNNGFRG